jgi:predicted alpha/beta hydrolase family esterase
MKRVIIVHGWGGHPDEAWMPWLSRELTARGYEVVVPEMPDTDHPRIETWIAKLTEVIGEPNDETHLVGHSVGCQAIIRYLSRVDEGTVGKVVLVAPWVTLHGEYDEEEKAIAEPWIRTPLDFEKAGHSAQSFTAIFSDDDPDVPLQNKEVFSLELGADIVVEHNKGHFSEDSGVTELPSALAVFL